MARQNVFQSNFTSGEVSPLVGGRLDAKVYANGLRTCKNFIVRPQGGAVFRTGTRIGERALNKASASRLIPFIYSDINGFEIELGDYSARIFQNGVPLLNTTNDYSAISAVAASGTNVRITFTNENRLACATSDNGAGLIRVTTTLPHNLVSGDRAYLLSEFASYIVTYVSSTVVDLVASSFPGVVSTYLVTKNLVSGSSSSGGLIKITTYDPHGLDTGDKIYMAHRSPGVDFSAVAATFDWVVTVVDDTSFTLDASVYTGGSDTADDTFTKWIRSGQRVVIDGSGGSQSLDGEWTAVQSTARDFLILANSTYVGATVGTYSLYFKHITLETPWSSEQLAEINFGQSADILYLTHPDVKTRKLIRSSADVWTLQELETTDGPYLPANDFAPNIDLTNPANGTKLPDVYLQVSSYSHTATVTASAAFINADDNLYLEYRSGDQWRLAQIGTVAGGETSVSATIVENVLLYLDSAIRLKNTPAQQSTYARIPKPGGAVRTTQIQRVDSADYLASSVSATTAGNLTSQFSNTFTQADVGKYVRYNYLNGTSAKWALISQISNSGATAAHAAALTMVANNATGNFVISDEVITGTVNAYRDGAAFSLFASTDVGRLIRLGWAGRWTWGKITAYTSASQVSVTFYEPCPRDPHDARKIAGALDGTVATALTTGRTYDWRLGAFSGTTGYPSVVALHEQRLVLARTDTRPADFYGSVTGDFENFSPTELDSTVLADNAYSFTLGSGRMNAIKWIESGTALVIGTSGGEWLAKSSSASQEPITPLNILVQEQSRNGSSRYAKAVRVGSSILFASRSERRMMEVAYLFSEDALKDKDITIAADHIIRRGGRIVEIVYQQNPNSIVWCLLSDGTLAALTHNNNQEILGWHRHEVGGSGFIESICCVPSEDGTSDVLHMVVKRNIGGDYRTIEYLTPDFYANGATARTGMVFLDCAHVISNFTGTTITGLNSLDGKTVTVISNGTVVSTTATVGTGVNSGILSYTLAPAANEVVIGLPYTGTLTSLPIEGGSPNGSSQGMKKRVAELKVRVFESFGFTSGTFLGSAPTTLVNVTPHDITARNDGFTPIPFFSGTVAINPKMGNDLESVWTIQQTNPYPLTVLSVTSVPETSQ